MENLVLFGGGSRWTTGHSERRLLKGNSLKVIFLSDRSQFCSSGQDVFGGREGSTLSGTAHGGVNSAAPPMRNF